MDTPVITISRLDIERLERYLATEPIRSLPGSSMLQDELIRAHVVEPEEIGPDIVTMNSTVGFLDEQSNKRYQLTLVYPEQAGSPGTVSIFAPVGSALLGLSVGQTIKWRIPAGRELWLRVVAMADKTPPQNMQH